MQRVVQYNRVHNSVHIYNPLLMRPPVRVVCVCVCVCVRVHVCVSCVSVSECEQVSE